jgi:hypothetical protein
MEPRARDAQKWPTGLRKLSVQYFCFALTDWALVMRAIEWMSVSNYLFRYGG